MLPGWWAQGSEPVFSLCLVCSCSVFFFLSLSPSFLVPLFTILPCFLSLSLSFVSAPSKRHMLIFSEQYTPSCTLSFQASFLPTVNPLLRNRSLLAKAYKNTGEIISDLIHSFHFLTRESCMKWEFLYFWKKLWWIPSITSYSNWGWRLIHSSRPQTAGKASIFHSLWYSTTTSCFRAHSSRWLFWKTEATCRRASTLRSCCILYIYIFLKDSHVDGCHHFLFI